MFRSLRFRIALSHALVLAVILIALGGVGQALLARELDASVTHELQAAADGAAERIEEAGHPVPPPDSDIPSQAGEQVAVYAAPSDALVGEPAEVPSWLRHYPDPVTDLQVEGERVRVVIVPAKVGATTVAWVAAGRSTVAEDRLLHRVRLLLLLGGAVAVLASLAAGWWLAGRAVEPVERAYEAQAGFAADASHELRTPLTFVRQGVEVLADKDPELGSEVLSEVDYLTGLSQRLLQLARAEGGAVELVAEPVDVGDVVRSSVHRSERVHGNVLTTDGEQVAALADPVALGAVLDGILENVARHGGGAADLAWRREGNEVVVAVADHGPGIPEELRAHAFDRFFRADPSRARDTGGAGLGLALARALVDALHGRLSLGSTPGGGLTVLIGLRAA
jgi:signal transduction histidine kinase